MGLVGLLGGFGEQQFNLVQPYFRTIQLDFVLNFGGLPPDPFTWILQTLPEFCKRLFFELVGRMSGFQLKRQLSPEPWLVILSKR